VVKVTTTTDGTPRDTIVRVATDLFGARSYPATSMRDIASEVGILAGSLYAHIDGKETLLLEIIERGIGEFLDEVTPAYQQKATAEERIRAMILAHVRVVDRAPQKTQIVFHQWRYLGEDNQKRVREQRRTYEDLFRDVLAEGVADGSFSDDLDLRVAVLSILGALNWTPEWLSTNSKNTVENISSRLADAMLKGVLSR
jgi:TetR/AcrR family transcriptional regulator, cholesterol catabolism regulator